jgi:hypothetical protein
MKVSVYETYLKKEDGSIMHFDIILPATVKKPELVYAIVKIYLEKKGHSNLEITGEECTFSLYQDAHKDWKPDLEKQGYHIVEFEGCR